MNDPRKRRVLFVDDEPAVLDGLRDSLRRQRKRWDMAFEEFPLRALERVKSEEFDVIISDMRMPELDGAGLLAHVRDIQPSAVRIILSGFTELEVAIRAVSVAHQFMTKPCEADALKEVVERTCAVRELLDGKELEALVGGMDSLPATPHIFAEAADVMANPHATAGSVAEVIEQDPAMCAKLLQMSNSGFFRLARPIAKVEDAIVYLGYNMIKNLVLSTEVFAKTLTGRGKRAIQRAVQEHSRLTAHVALNLAEDKRVREDAFLAAILHDIGKIVLASESKDYPAQVQATMKEQACGYAEAERQLFGVSHAEIGAYLLGLWGVPFNVVEAVAYHHRELSPVEQHPLDAVGVVALADALVSEIERGKAAVANDNDTVERVVQQLGLEARLPEFRQLAERAVSELKAS